MHKVPVVLAAFIVFLGCDASLPTSPSAAKGAAGAEQCPTSTLDITGTWVDWDRTQGLEELSWNSVSYADTLRIELADDPNPPSEPGVTHYDYTHLVYYSPSERDSPETIEVFADLEPPLLLWEYRGKIGVYYDYDADGGQWEGFRSINYRRSWDMEIGEYVIDESGWVGAVDMQIWKFDKWLGFAGWWAPWFSGGGGGGGWDNFYKRADGSTPVEPEPEPVAELTPEIVGLYGTLVSTFTNIFFAALVPGTTSVPGEGGGSVEIAGNDWTLQDYSPDGALIANGTLNVGLDQAPIPLTGTITLSGSHEAELILDMALSVDAEGLSATGTITINGAEFDVAEVSAAATAAAEAATNDPSYVDAWVGEYEGTGDFALSNGVSGEDRPVSISIVRISPKQVTVSATLVYGEGRNDFIQETDILQPDDPEQITLEVRYLNAKTVYALTQEEDTITGSIATSSLRLGGTWGQDQIITAIEVVRQ
ncbi:MAG: hypothetical protein OXM01_13960 [Gemmatimonadota bacterium]|nr:hypothetical protein [Gemmatimonadota bacterium]